MNLNVDVEKAIAKWKPFLDEMNTKYPNFKWTTTHFDYQKWLDDERKQRIKKEKLKLRKDKLNKLSNSL